MIDIGKKIKDLRVEKNLLQKDLAKKLNIARNTVTQYEKNLARPSYEVLISIAKFFNVSTDFLLGLEDESGRKIYNTVNNHIADNHGTINQNF